MEAFRSYCDRLAAFDEDLREFGDKIDSFVQKLRECHILDTIEVPCCAEPPRETAEPALDEPNPPRIENETRSNDGKLPAAEDEGQREDVCDAVPLVSDKNKATCISEPEICQSEAALEEPPVEPEEADVPPPIDDLPPIDLPPDEMLVSGTSETTHSKKKKKTKKKQH